LPNRKSLDMINLFHSFYSKLSLIFLLLILLLGTGSLIIAFNAAEHLFDEVEQALNREYAASMAVELQPFVRDGINEEQIKGAIHYMMVLNPMVEIYLLDNMGSILAFFTGPGDKVIRESVDLSPVKEFILSDGFQTIRGDDPRTENQKKPFSAAPMRIGNHQGYIYIILRGQSYDKSHEMIRSSYYLKTGLITFILAFLATLLAGLSLFSLLTRRLRNLGSAVKAYEPGNWNGPVEIGGSDELSVLGETFNEMALSINSGIKNLHEAEKQRRDLIANISHDLRSPLTSIRGNLETILLKDDTLTGDERKQYLETILKNVSGFQKLVEELFELARLESREIKLKPERFQIAELAQDVLQKLKPMAEKSQINLSMENPGHLPVINGDIAMMERVLTNILENALAHTEAGGTVYVSFNKDSSSLYISISDTGEGISAEDISHIFERFYRADKSRDRRTQSTGLGLAIAREIVELHEGSINVSSRPGEGSTFTVIIPGFYSGTTEQTG